MTFSRKTLAVMLALSSGAALAAAPASTSTHTVAGTQISNTAHANYLDPSTNAKSPTIDSNSVITNVLAIPAFDVVYDDGSTDGTAGTAVATLPLNYDVANAVAGQTITRYYDVVNNGNVDNYKVTINPDTTGTPNALPTGATVTYQVVDSAGVPLAGQTYDAAGNPVAGSAPAASINLQVPALQPGQTGIVRIAQIITLPAGSAVTGGDIYTVSPHGTAPAGPGALATDPATYPSIDEANNINPPATTPTNKDLEFTRIKVFTPVLTVTPPADSDPNTPGAQAPGTPAAQDAPPPNALNPGNSYLSPVTPTTGTPINTGSPNPGTPITVSTAPGSTLGDQDAYPKSDSNTSPDVVTFESQVQNVGAASDSIRIRPTTPPGATSVQVLDAAGFPLMPDANGLYTLPGMALPEASFPSSWS